MKKIISLTLTLIMVLSMGIITLNISAAAPEALPSFFEADMLYAHAVEDSAETEAWHHWQHADSYRGYDEDDFKDLGLTEGEGISDEKYFFLPSSIKNSVVILNTYTVDVTIDSTTIPAGEAVAFTFENGSTYDVAIGNETEQLKFMCSSAEASVFINNPDADGEGTDLFSYLSLDKENSAKATGAIVDDEGNVDNTPIKKIKGRGNSTWEKNKKPFNVTYDKAVSVDGMEKTKKLSLLANYQDSALIRNRFLQDLSDAVGMPYASDSRFVDLYMNGEYLGSYQLTQKVDIGKNNLIPEIDDNTHLDADGNLLAEFPFLVEIDASATNGDYYTKSDAAGCKLTVKGPELDEGDPNYNAVLNFVKTKFDAMHRAICNNSADMGDLVDIDSLSKILIINELGKNWDVSISSLYFTYKQAEDGSWKFFASPVWDYDNSLGNATGVKGDLNYIKVTDYEEPTGWWVKYKAGTGSGKTNKYTTLGYAARNATVMDYCAQIWFDEFLPAINAFNEAGTADGELLSKDTYYAYLEGTADMNYELGWLMTTGSWICDHSSLTNGSFDYETLKFVPDTNATTYDITSYKDQYQYTIDWLNTRTAWLSAQYAADYEGEIAPPAKGLLLGDADLDGDITVKDATLIQKHVAKILTLDSDAQACSDVDGNQDITVKDATAIQKFVAKIETGYNIGGKI